MLVAILLGNLFMDVKLARVPSRLGHTIGSIDYWLTVQRDTYLKNSTKRYKLPIFFLDAKALDQEIYFLVSKLVRLSSYRLWNPTFNLAHWLGIEKRITLELIGSNPASVAYLLKGTNSPLIKLIELKNRNKEEMYTKLGIRSDKLVLLCVRDPAYGQSIKFEKGEVSAEYRNSNFTNYLDGIRLLLDSGYSVIRMGNKHKGDEDVGVDGLFSFPKLKFQYSIDQIDLFRDCAFVLSTDTGLNNLAILSRKPLYMVNMGSFTDRFLHGLTKLVLYKSFVDAETQQRIPLTDILSFHAQTYIDSKSFSEKGISILENSSSDIFSFVAEAIQFHESRWSQSVESRKLTSYFKDMMANEGHEMGLFAFPNFYSKGYTW